MTPPPAFTYRFSDPAALPTQVRGDDARVIERDGLRGLNLRSIRGRFLLPEHTVDEPQGAVALRVMPLQDLSPVPIFESHKRSNPNFHKFVFLSNRENWGDTASCEFSFYYSTHWHPVLQAKFKRGEWVPHLTSLGMPQGACASANFFQMRAFHWYQMLLTWNKAENRYKIYANGVLVGSEDTTCEEPLDCQEAGPMLYGGSPAFAYASIEFFDEELSPPQATALHEETAPHQEPSLQSELRRMYLAEGLDAFEWQPDASWEQALDLSLTHREQLQEFTHQGYPSGITFTEEGLRVETPPLSEFRTGTCGPEGDHSRNYFWTRKYFEGDLAVSFDFKSLQHGGLCLFIAQASGMQGEDFHEDYFLRTDGVMSVVHKEDARNYHWEFYREMVDTRNDLVTHAMLKNPWLKPVAFQVENRQWELDRWYRFSFVQEGARLRGAIDGVQVIDAEDNGFDNNGPVLRGGHIAIRCMMRSSFVFRNLRVWTRPDFETVSPT